MGRPHGAGVEGWMLAGVAALVLGGLLWFYGSYYPLHQDLAGGVLTGQLADALGKAFGRYSIYFPPAERGWFLLAAWLGDLTGLGADLAVVAMTGMATMIGCGLAWRIRRVTHEASPLFFAASLAVLVIVPILFKNVFGLREHLVVAGLWPYLVLRISDPGGTRIGWRLRAVVGLWMGAALLFKYVYSLVVLLVELVDALVQRRAGLLLRMENVVSGAVVFLYLLLWLGIDPAQREAVSAMVSAIDANTVEPGANLSKLAWNSLGGALFLVMSRLSGVPMRSMLIGLAVLAGTLVAAWSQERWYTHHMFPITMSCIGWWWIAARNLRGHFHALAALLVAFPVTTQFMATRGYHRPLAELERTMKAGGLTVSGKRVALLNMHPSPYNEYLVSHGGLRWTPQMNIAYVAAELKAYDTPENAGKALPPVSLTDPGRRLLHDRMLRLWEDMPADVLIVDRTSSWPLRHVTVDWQRAFSRDARFAAIMARYRPVLVHDGEDLKFTYYVRAR